VKRDLMTYGVAAADKIQVIPLGLKLNPFLDSGACREAFRRELHLSGVERLVGIVGRIFPIKNHHLFLEAARLVAREDPAARFVIVGDGILRPELERQAQEMGIADRVMFTGWRRDLPGIYADLDVLAVTSNNEGTPVSAIEAMASGCPVVATNVGGLSDLICEGETGYLVPPGDARAVATALLRVLHQPETARRMGETARMAARQRFSAQRLITDVEQLYLGLLERKRAVRGSGLA
jgi:glycosyltransferase involved in cell wall biosynthesis